MALETNSCIRCVGECKTIIKHGKTSSGKQRNFCKVCGKTKVSFYSYLAYCSDLNRKIIVFMKEGLGIRSTARILGISVNTLLKRIVLIARNIKSPLIVKNKTYEVDEIRTFIRKKSTPVWIVYALDRMTKNVVSFCVGNRTNNTLNIVIKTLKLSGAQKIYTDGSIIINILFLLNCTLSNVMAQIILREATLHSVHI